MEGIIPYFLLYNTVNSREDTRGVFHYREAGILIFWNLDNIVLHCINFINV